jgi:hypothetical protein
MGEHLVRAARGWRLMALLLRRVRRLRPCALCACAFFALAALATRQPAIAGAWTLPAGKGQVIVTGTFLGADRYYDSRGRILRGPSYRKFEASAFLEYGFTDRFTGLFSPSLLATSVAGGGAAYVGPGYTEIGGRFRLLGGESWIVSLQASARLPAPANRLNPAAACCTATEADVRLLIGKSFMLGAWPSFINAEAGYRLRGGLTEDELRIDVTLGVRPRPDWLILLQSFNVLANDGDAGIFTEARYHKVQLGAVWDFAHQWSLQLAGIVTISGRSAPVEAGFVTGLWYRF